MEESSASGTLATGKRQLGGGRVQCGRCGKKFQTEKHVDAHIQASHIPQTQSLHCPSSYCDVLDCFHRSVRVDALSGALLPDSSSAASDGGGALGGRVASAKQRRMALANEAVRRERAGAGSSGVSRPLESEPATSVVPELPQVRKCSPDAMEAAQIRCESIMLQCFPFHASDVPAPSTQRDRSGAAQSTGTGTGMSGEEMHALYQRFHASLCAPLHCTPDGRYANEALVLTSKALGARTRLGLILFGVLVAAVALWYFFLFQLKREFGWGAPKTAMGSGASALTAGAKVPHRNRMVAWLTMQKKKQQSKIL